MFTNTDSFLGAFEQHTKLKISIISVFKPLSTRDKKYSIKLQGIVILPHRLCGIE